MCGDLMLRFDLAQCLNFCRDNIGELLEVPKQYTIVSSTCGHPRMGGIDVNGTNVAVMVRMRKYQNSHLSAMKDDVLLTYVCVFEDCR